MIEQIKKAIEQNPQSSADAANAVINVLKDEGFTQYDWNDPSGVNLLYQDLDDLLEDAGIHGHQDGEIIEVYASIEMPDVLVFEWDAEFGIWERVK